MTALSQLSIPESIWLYANPVDRLRPELRRLHFLFRPKSRRHQATHELAARVETLVKMRLRWLGFAVEMTGHRCPFDALLNRRVRVEIKGARLGADGRYQARIHNDQADFLVFLALGRCPVFFIIPAAALGRRSTVKLPGGLEGYSGKWAAYRENWKLLEKER